MCLELNYIYPNCRCIRRIGYYVCCAAKDRYQATHSDQRELGIQDPLIPAPLFPKKNETKNVKKAIDKNGNRKVGIGKDLREEKKIHPYEKVEGFDRWCERYSVTWQLMKTGRVNCGEHLKMPVRSKAETNALVREALEKMKESGGIFQHGGMLEEGHFGMVIGEGSQAGSVGEGLVDGGEEWKETDDEAGDSVYEEALEALEAMVVGGGHVVEGADEEDHQKRDWKGKVKERVEEWSGERFKKGKGKEVEVHVPRGAGSEKKGKAREHVEVYHGDPVKKRNGQVKELKNVELQRGESGKKAKAKELKRVDLKIRDVGKKVQGKKVTESAEVQDVERPGSSDSDKADGGAAL